MVVSFTETLGGAPAVSMYLGPLNIEASVLGAKLEELLLTKLKIVEEEIEKL